MEIPKLQEDQIRYVAKLARLELTDEEVQLFSQQLNNVLGYMVELTRVDVSKVEPTFHPIPLQNVFREDRVRPSLSVDKALENAPSCEGNLFKVPRILPSS